MLWLTAADRRHVTLLGLLDMSAAFDCVDHQLLLQRLEKHCGLHGSVDIGWPYLAGRTQKVLYSGLLSEAQRFSYGVPQGSVLGSLLFSLYLASLSSVVLAHGLNLHQYADDCQLYPWSFNYSSIAIPKRSSRRRAVSSYSTQSVHKPSRRCGVVECTVCASTRTRLSSCGWARNIKLRRSPYTIFQCCSRQRRLWI